MFIGIYRNNFNPRSPWGERQPRRHGRRSHQLISIHAPRGGSDVTLRTYWMPFASFQSTLPVGGATVLADRQSLVADISIHAPRGGSDLFDADLRDGSLISIHAPRGGSDPGCRYQRVTIDISIHAPRGGSDIQHPIILRYEDISIHAPRGGSDERSAHTSSRPPNFNPRSPWGERLYRRANGHQYIRISIHAPRGGSDKIVSTLNIPVDISIHAPRGGSD